MYEAAGNEGLEKSNGDGVQVFDGGFGSSETDECTYADDSEKEECGKGTGAAADEPPDGEAHGEPVQNHANAEGRRGGFVRCVAGVCQGCAVEKRVYEEACQGQGGHCTVNTHFAAADPAFDKLGSNEAHKGDGQTFPSAGFHGFGQDMSEGQAQDGGGHESFQEGNNGGFLAHKAVKQGTEGQAENAKKEEEHGIGSQE